MVKQGRPEHLKTELILLMACGYGNYKKIEILKKSLNQKYYASNLNKSIVILKDEEVISSESIGRKYNKKEYHFNWDFLFKEICKTIEELLKEVNEKFSSHQNSILIKEQNEEGILKYLRETIEHNKKSFVSIKEDWSRLKLKFLTDIKFQNIIRSILILYFKNVIFFQISRNYQLKEILTTFILNVGTIDVDHSYKHMNKDFLEFRGLSQTLWELNNLTALTITINAMGHINDKVRFIETSASIHDFNDEFINIKIQ